MTKRNQRRQGMPAERAVALRDAGVSLVELVMTLAIMSIVTALVTASILQMYRSSGRDESLSIEISQLQTAFQQLDRSVRYASGISEPNAAATPGGSWYVEWTAVTAGATVCTQLRLEGPSGQLQRRTRPPGGPTGAWATVASELVGTDPFTLEPASSSTYPHQRLTVNIEVRSAGESAVGRRSEMTFTALNTNLTTAAGSVCTDMDRP
ncbi:type II secretion system protein [Actinoplanes sp. NPDC051475]|uniref:PulJ/GspJ family protein n=1 Tax=Actinoplanes sp. NPDC051475 TaxID=3157225 RepID=UPI00344C711A